MICGNELFFWSTSCFIYAIYKPFSKKKKEQENDFPKHTCSPSTWKAKSEELRGHGHVQIVYVYKIQGQSEGI